MGVGSALLGGAGPLFMSRGPPTSALEGVKGVMKKSNPPGIEPSFFPPWEKGHPFDHQPEGTPQSRLPP